MLESEIEQQHRLVFGSCHLHALTGSKRIVGEHFEANQIRGCVRRPALRKMKSPITVIIADDHPIFRKGLCEVLSEDQTIKLVAEVADGLAAFQKIRELKPRAAVLDLDMPQMNGLQVARKISEC